MSLVTIFATRYPSNGAPTLALLLTGTVAPVPAVFEMGDRTAIPPYDYDAMRVVAHDMPPIVRASWFRGVSALPNTFAHRSYIKRTCHRGRRRSHRIQAALSERPARCRFGQRQIAKRAGPHVRCGKRARRKATLFADAALPMRCTSTASFPDMARLGRPGSRMLPSTNRPGTSA